MLRLRSVIWFLLLFTPALATHYECLPYPVASVCIMEYISYHPGDTITFPTGYQRFQIKPARSTRKTKSKVIALDTELYEAMHRPSSIEMTYVQMEVLNLPPELLLGNFADNSLASVNVSIGQYFQITYLDLMFNSISTIDFVGRLVNLEILHLESNRIDSLPGSALNPLKKLKYLYLQSNYFATIPWHELPQGLLHLDCYLNRVETADFTDINLPSLEYLNLQNNLLTTINVTAIRQAAPRLKEAHLHNDRVSKAEMDAMYADLTSNNISFADPFWFGLCPPDKNHLMINGRCVELKEDPPGNTGMAVLLSTVVIGTAMLFVYILVLVFRYMNR